MKKLIILFSFFSVVFIWSCQSDDNQAVEADRPFQPWVFRSVLDLQPRMLTLALNENLWAAYHADNGALYKVWKGNVELTGAVYDTYHGPQPVSLGDGYIVNEIENPWSVTVGGKKEDAKSHFKGHRMVKGGVELMYDLELKDGQKIRVNERPEYVSSESGLHGFERVFTLENVPEGAQVNLKNDGEFCFHDQPN